MEEPAMKTKPNSVTFAAIILMALTANALCDYISNIKISPASPACLTFNQKVNITFDYSVSEPAGAVIFIRPFTAGSLTPNYAAHPSPTYPAGKGTGTGYFTITTGVILVDHLRFQILSSDQSKTILEFFIPVEYHFSTHAIYDIKLDPDTPASLVFGQNVNIKFNYTTNQPGGVRIFARPMTGGATTPGYGAHGSPLYPNGSASGTGFFTITLNNAIIDHIRFQMFNENQSQLLLEYFLPVDYHYAAHAINNIIVTPTPPHCMLFNENVNITFDYTTAEPGGIRIFVRPFTGNAATPGYGAHGSPNYPTGNGNGNGWFTIMAGNALVDRLQFRMTNADQSQELLKFFVPVLFPYSAHKITNISFAPSAPAYLTSGHNVDIKFNYLTSQSGGVRIFARPFSQGALTPGYGAHGSPLYPTGSGNGTGFYNISSTTSLVDHTRFQMLNSDQSQLLLEFFLPVSFFYGNQLPTGLERLTEAEPGAFVLHQNFPNPFNPSTTIEFALAKQEYVTLKIYNLTGELVAVLLEEQQPAGTHRVYWNASAIASGVYVYRLQAGSFVQSKKLVLMR
jgi:hypothetical protein